MNDGSIRALIRQQVIFISSLRNKHITTLFIVISRNSIIIHVIKCVIYYMHQKLFIFYLNYWTYCQPGHKYYLVMLISIFKVIRLLTNEKEKEEQRSFKRLVNFQYVITHIKNILCKTYSKVMALKYLIFPLMQCMINRKSECITQSWKDLNEALISSWRCRCCLDVIVSKKYALVQDFTELLRSSHVMMGFVFEKA